MTTPNEYKDFDAFLLKALKVLKDDPKFDYWLGATTSAFGTQKLSRLMSALNLSTIGTAALAGGAFAGVLFPVLGAAVGAGVGIAAAKYLNKASSDEAREIAGNLQAAKVLYEECVASSISDAKKKELIDDLFNQLISGEKISK